MIKNILIIHGWDSSSREHWFQSAKKKLEKNGYKVFVPDMPGAYFPKKEEWITVIRDFHPDKSWGLLGLSLGGVAVLKYLEETEQPIGRTILMATPYDSMNFKPIIEFFGDGFDWEKIKKNSLCFDILNETNDPVVPKENGSNFSKKLNGKLHILPGGTHFHIFDLNILKEILEK